MKRVLVIIVTYNGMRWLERCLSSVISAPSSVISSEVEKSVFVVDNDSTDGSADWIQGHFPGVKLVRSAENLGFTKANNLGFEWALSHNYDYVYLLNQDAWLAPGALETLVDAAEKHPEYAVLSPLQMTDGYKEPDRLFKKDKTPPAAHWLVPVKALREIGPFSDLFPYYGQDDDWCNRARYHGWKIGIIPQAKAVHDLAHRVLTHLDVIDHCFKDSSKPIKEKEQKRYENLCKELDL